MATVITATIDNIAFSPGQVIGKVNKLFSKKFGKSTAGRIALGKDPLTEIPTGLTVLAPNDASMATADAFFNAFKLLDGIVEPKAFPEPLGCSHSFDMILKPISDGAGGFKTDPASFPPNAGSGYAVAKQLCSVTLVSDKRALRRELGATLNTRDDSGLARRGIISTLNPIQTTSYPASVYRTPTYSNTFPAALTGDASLNTHPNESFNAAAPGVGKLSFSRLRIFPGMGEKTEYNGSSDVGVTRSPVFGPGATDPFDIRDAPTGLITIGDKDLRMKIDEKWYVSKITANMKGKRNELNMYDGSNRLTWGWLSEHDESHMLDLRNVAGGTFVPFLYVLSMWLGIQQGDDGAGPLVNDDTGVDDATDPNNPVSSTLFTMYRGEFGDYFDSAAYDDVADRDQWAI